MKIVIGLIFPLTFLLGCSTYSDEDLLQFDKDIENYISQHKLKLTKSDSGIYYKINSIGDGEFIQAKDSVYIRYSGKLMNGTIVDEQTEAIGFRVENLIVGWKETLYLLKEGGDAFVIIPPQLGYGNEKLEKIPQNSILIYTLHVDKVI